MKLTLGFSSCPNDTFIFDALVHNKIDTQGIEFAYSISDVQDLNESAEKGLYDITKLSYFAFAKVSHLYQILDSGSALGYANGPLYICKKGAADTISENSKIAIPGKNTTAHLLFSMAYPDYVKKEFFVFHEIEDAINSNLVEAGVIIHENRFTYAERGFEVICDLGSFWEQKTGLPIPLGGIAIKSDLPQDVKQLVNALIRESIQFAFDNPEQSKPFIDLHAQEMQEEIKQKHIALFVNNYSLDLGIDGKHAIQELYLQAQKLQILPLLDSNKLFLNS